MIDIRLLRGKYVNLENLNCKIKSGCKEHPPWPRGICNKCQPNTVYLNRQVILNQIQSVYCLHRSIFIALLSIAI